MLPEFKTDMSALVIDGKALAKRLQAELLTESQQVKSQLGRKPHLAVVLVGDNPASAVYVKSKTARAKRCGLDVSDYKLPETASDEDVQRLLKKLNALDDVDGILMQLPLPSHLDELGALLCIAPHKDVDGLTPTSQGMLMRGKGEQAYTFRPCTPQGCILLIREARRQLGKGEDLSGLNAVVLGRSILVGKPAALLLLEENCSVSLLHSRTKDPESFLRNADIVIAAVGTPEMLKADVLKKSAIIIDVGINRSDDGRLLGDVDFNAVSEQVAAITPVPGGVGPMTITVLLQNTVKSARERINWR